MLVRMCAAIRRHYRTNSFGLNLNRFYDNPAAEKHEVIWAVKQLQLHWSAQRRLLLYIDFHSHASKAGCFFLANRFPRADTAE